MSPGRAGMLLSCIPPHYHEAVFTSRHDDDDSTRSAALVPTTQSHFDPSVYPPPSWAATLLLDTPAPRRVVVPTMPSRQTSSPLPSPPSKSWPASVSPPQRSLTSTPHVVQIEDPDKSVMELDEKAELPFSSLENGGKVQPKRRNYAPIVIAAFVLLVFHSSRLVWSKYQEHNLSIDLGTSASSSAETFITSASATTVDEPRPQLPADWWHRCTKQLVVPAGMYTDRLDKLAATLKGGAWISEPGASVEYYLGAFGPGVWHPSERAFLVAVDSAGSVTILTPAFEEGRARLIPLPSDVVKRVTWLSWTESESPYTVLINHLGNKPQIVLEAGVRNFVVDGVHNAQKQRGMDPSLPAFDVGSAVASIRERKDEREIGLMRCANEATLHAIRKTRMQMYIGISESMTRKILYNEMSHVGLKDYSALVLFGPNAALPHGSGTDRTLGSDEFALIDAGGYWGGYIADITRTFFLPDSNISDEHREAWEIVRLAQRAPASLLHYAEPADKVQLSWLDDRARETIKRGMAALGVPPQKGHKPDYTVFTHRLGHGIGLEGHESPYAVQGPLGERDVLTGHTFTLEPGVYIPQDSDIGDESIRGLGIRLEDVVVVREVDGRMKAEFLTGPVDKWGDV